MSRANPTSSRAGFTLVELLVIAPIALLVITGFIALMVTMVGDVLVSRGSNVMTYDIQNALSTIEDDVRLSTEFLTTTGLLPSPQGKNDNTQAFTGSSSELILGEIATDKNPIDPLRRFVHYNTPLACGSDQEYQNRIFFTTVIYFVKDGSLWRRTYVPTPAGTLCQTPWQVNTCSPGYTDARCQANDSEVLKDINSFSVEYFVDPEDTVAVSPSLAGNASTLQVTIEGEKIVAGRTINATSTGRVTKLSSLEVNLAPPDPPVVTGTISGLTAVFSWPGVPTASSYIVKYNINGGGWITSSENTTETSFSVPANHGDTVSVQVLARNTTGASAVGAASANIPIWTDCSLQNNWVDIDIYHEKCTFTMTKQGVVLVQGAMKGGSITHGTTLFTLPPGYRPSHRLIFSALLSEKKVRVDIEPNGNVSILDVPSVGANHYLGLGGIAFIPAGSGYTRTSLTFANGWSNYTYGYPPLQVTQDGAGRVHVQGMVNTGAMSTEFAYLPAGLQSAKPQLLPAHGDWQAGGYNEVVVYSNGSTGSLIGRSTVTSWLSIQFMYYPASITGWQTLSPISGVPGNGQLGNGWVYYNAGADYWANPQYIKADDGIVLLKGLIRSGSTTPGTLVAQLPPGYRPRNRLIFNAISENGFTRLDVHPAGGITIVSGGSAGWTSLEGIKFIAEQ